MSGEFVGDFGMKTMVGGQAVGRRGFLKSGVTAASVAAISARAYASPVQKSRRVGLIGCGWYGKCDVLQLLNIEPAEIVSVCDVDQNLLSEAAELFASRQASGKQPRAYADYRTMLAEKDLDLVFIATPDHWHALPMIEAVKSGADVYVQKPTAVDVLESKAMLDAARATKRVVQVGTQRRSTPHLIEAKERVIDAGLLGNIAHAEVYCYYHMRARQHPEPSTPPPHFDYEMWTGPAPMRPYTEMVHPRSWRAFTEYGNGIVGDMCVHMLDLVRWALGLGWPKSISSSGGILMDKASLANISDTQTATFEFEEMNVVWTHRTWGAAPDPEYPWGATIYGDRGTLKLSVNKYDFIPQGRGERLHGEAVIEADKYPTDLTDQRRWNMEVPVASAIRGHIRNLLDCIDSRDLPVADIEQGHISSAACMLANLSMGLGRSVRWDAERHEIVGDDAANEKKMRPYRAPWIHPAT